MKKNEKDLFLELCRFKDVNREKLKAYISCGAATPEVLGNLLCNRMAAIACGVLKENDLLSKVNREFQTTLTNTLEQNKLKNESYFSCLKMISEVLEKCKEKYALLKGAYLCGLYPEGYRTSNDIDLLVQDRNVEEIGRGLNEAGFRQGYIKNGEFKEASRQEIISSKMLRGETVPYVLEVNLPFMKYLEIDVNYSLDHKNNEDDAVREFIINAREIDMGDHSVTTLDKYFFILHLCSHLYKEAATYPWVMMGRDMTLYKMCDLYLLLREYREQKPAVRSAGADTGGTHMQPDFETLFQYAARFNMNTECFYAFYVTRELFNLKNIITDSVMSRLVRNMTSSGIYAPYNLVKKVISPADKQVYWYEDNDIVGRFFTKDRAAALTKEKELYEGIPGKAPTLWDFTQNPGKAGR